MNTKSLERRAARLQEKLQPVAPVGLPPTYWLDRETDRLYIVLEGDERSHLPPNVYGFDPNQDGIDE
jgi:hypothetical protein